jgi:protoporphyrinogen oxidase
MMARGGRSFALLGGGMLGQALALRLREAGHEATILEAAPDTGGLAGAWTVGGVTCDIHYHVILPGDRRLLDLLEELGLSDEIAWVRSRTGFFANGRLAPLDSGLDYLRLPALGLGAKLRLAFTLMMAARIRDGAPLEQVSVEDWLVRWSGREAFERLWRPLLRAKLGSNHEIASAAFIWATIRRLYLARSSGAKTETLGFVRGGYARVLGVLRRHLDEQGVRVVTGCPVSSVARQGDGFRLETGQGALYFDRVVSTLPAGVTARVCKGLSPEIAARLAGVVYQGVICATVVLDRPLSANYLTYLTEADLPFTAIVESSALTGCAQFGGRHVVYLPRYVTQADPFWGLDDDAVRERFEAGLARIHPGFDRDAIAGFRVSRVRNVMAVPTIGYSAMVPPIRTNIDGLYIVNSAQIVDGTLNVDATLGVVEQALPVLLGDDALASEDRSAA